MPPLALKRGQYSKAGRCERCKASHKVCKFPDGATSCTFCTKVGCECSGLVSKKRRTVPPAAPSTSNEALSRSASTPGSSSESTSQPVAGPSTSRTAQFLAEAPSGGSAAADTANPESVVAAQESILRDLLYAGCQGVPPTSTSTDVMQAIFPMDPESPLPSPIDYSLTSEEKTALQVPESSDAVFVHVRLSFATFARTMNLRALWSLYFSPKDTITRMFIAKHTVLDALEAIKRLVAHLTADLRQYADDANTQHLRTFYLDILASESELLVGLSICAEMFYKRKDELPPHYKDEANTVAEKLKGALGVVDYHIKLFLLGEDSSDSQLSTLKECGAAMNLASSALIRCGMRPSEVATWELGAIVAHLKRHKFTEMKMRITAKGLVENVLGDINVSHPDFDLWQFLNRPPHL